MKIGINEVRRLLLAFKMNVVVVVDEVQERNLDSNVISGLARYLSGGMGQRGSRDPEAKSDRGCLENADWGRQRDIAGGGRSGEEGVRRRHRDVDCKIIFVKGYIQSASWARRKA
jgi:hypothetical protein